ncbi:Cellular retinaldehyde binding/alpha-tocopherol transport [Heracleum sosnowskyi]|uniref:Cellular retinaldehyde binding/alpha-tocopherol transport n=1 Tax=Heracleum sosnowskyi TaxID=360622 RepID=A0AAD8IGZ7_9APIA|nr:Cellular retinaldehyde binding/alpha-tocopherol transport [Heracleum sosnowskyi]
MTVEVIKAEATVSHLDEKVNVVDEVVVDVADSKKDVEKTPSFKEESNFVSDLKDHEKKALTDLKAKLEEAILGNSLFKKEEPKVVEEKVEEVVEEKVEEVVEEKVEEVVEEKKDEEKIECVKEAEKVEEKEAEKVEEKEAEKAQEEGEASKKPVEKKGLNGLKLKIKEALKGHSLLKKKSKKEVEEKEKPVVEEKECEESKPEGEAVVEEKVEEVAELVKTEESEEKKAEVVVEEAAEVVKTEECEVKEPEVVEEVAEVVKTEECEEEKKVEEEVVIVDKDISLWGVPLLPSKADEGTDVVLLKFLRARDFKVNEAFEMLKKTLEWRKEWKIDSILDEDLGSDLSVAAYMNGVDLEGHPICYNILGVFNDEELYQKAFGSEEKVKFFLRWRFQLMERGIQKLELKPSGVTSLLQVTDLRNSPPGKKEARLAVKQAISLLQDNYPEFVARNIWINVPFWYHAYHSVVSTMLTQRTKSKDVRARPAKVTETLIKYIPIEEIPIQYGGLKRESDYEFSAGDGVASELIIKASSTATIEIPAPEAGTTFIWDTTVLGWEVNYKEEFIPTDEGSYTIIVQKQKKLGAVEGPVRNTYRTNEPGKIVLTIDNCSSKKKKVFYRHKVKKCAF